jgi:hypothetical protein
MLMSRVEISSDIVPLAKYGETVVGMMKPGPNFQHVDAACMACANQCSQYLAIQPH